MTVRKISSITRLIGATSDTKPTTGVEIGSIFTEVTTDTVPKSKDFIWDGTQWALRVDSTT